MSKFQKISGQKTILMVASLILGFTVWSILNSYQIATIQLDAPICFYNTHENINITAPESIKVLLNGKRSYFFNDGIRDIGIFLNAQNLSRGTHMIRVESEMLNVGPGITIVDYHPHTLKITVS